MAIDIYETEEWQHNIAEPQYRKRPPDHVVGGAPKKAPDVNKLAAIKKKREAKDGTDSSDKPST